MFNILFLSPGKFGASIVADFTTKDTLPEAVEEMLNKIPLQFRAQYISEYIPVYLFKNPEKNTGMCRLIGNSIKRSENMEGEFNRLVMEIFEAGRKFQRTLGVQLECTKCKIPMYLDELLSSGAEVWRCSGCDAEQLNPFARH